MLFATPLPTTWGLGSLAPSFVLLPFPLFFNVFRYSSPFSLQVLTAAVLILHLNDWHQLHHIHWFALSHYSHWALQKIATATFVSQNNRRVVTRARRLLSRFSSKDIRFLSDKGHWIRILLDHWVLSYRFSCYSLELLLLFGSNTLHSGHTSIKIWRCSAIVNWGSCILLLWKFGSGAVKLRLPYRRCHNGKST